jgi:hypothetical protein
MVRASLLLCCTCITLKSSHANPHETATGCDHCQLLGSTVQRQHHNGQALTRQLDSLAGHPAAHHFLGISSSDKSTLVGPSFVAMLQKLS